MWQPLQGQNGRKLLFLTETDENDKIANFKRLPFRTQISYNDVSYTIFYSRQRSFILILCIMLWNHYFHAKNRLRKRGIANKKDGDFSIPLRRLQTSPILDSDKIQRCDIHQILQQIKLFHRYFMPDAVKTSFSCRKQVNKKKDESWK